MKHFTHSAFVFVSAAMAACCLAAGHARTAAVRLVRRVRPVPSAAQTSALVDSAGRALDALRRRMQAAARRALAASLLLLAVPGAGLAGRTAPEFWTDIQRLPAGSVCGGGRTLRLPAPPRDERPDATPPPGARLPSRTRDGPDRCVTLFPAGWPAFRAGTLPLRI